MQLHTTLIKNYNRMKKTLLALLLILGVSYSSTIQAQKTKTLSSSSKKKPDWCGGVANGFVITIASSDSQEDAQQKALAKVKEQIISSVAENIQTSSEYNRSESMTNTSSEYQESFKTATKTRAADIPFMKGISITNVSEFYWEQVGTKTSSIYYYHLKYPFSKDQLRKLVLEYEKADKKLTDQLNGLVNKIPTLESVEVMSQTIKELTALAEGFIDVDPRRDEANVAIAKIKDILKNVSIETVSATLGEIRVSLRVGDRVVSTTRKPKVKSNCAKITSIKSSGLEWIITYNYDECYEDPDNVVKVTFQNGYGKTTNDYFFDVNAEKIAIFVNNDINISGEGNCHISITSKYESAFIIEKVILNFGAEAPLIVENINKTFEGKGNHDLDIILSDAIDKEVYSAKKYAMIKGTIHYKSSKSGEKSVYKMFNQNITTAW